MSAYVIRQGGDGRSAGLAAPMIVDKEVRELNTWGGGSLKEAGRVRCLRPGGKYVCFTFETAGDAGYRWFQSSWERAAGVRSFHDQELRGLFEEAGFRVKEVRGDRLSLFMTATKPG